MGNIKGSLEENLHRRSYGVHLTSNDIFLKYIFPENRKKVFEEKGFQKYVSEGILERRISKNKGIGLLITDKEAGVFFPKPDGETDLSEMFQSKEPEFREWCIDYFEDSWKNATSFQETKLKK